MTRAEGLSRSDLRALSAARVTALLRACGELLGLPARATLAVLVAGDEELRRLNGLHRGVDAATDVLAFPTGDLPVSPPWVPGGESRRVPAAHVGDIAINLPRALRQAPDGTAELRLLAVHGLLHCLGHDHAEPAEAAAMTAATRALLPGQDVPDLVAGPS